LIPSLSNPQSWNRFSYTLNNPVGFTDPTGHFTCSSDKTSDDYCPGHSSPTPPIPPASGSEGDGGERGGRDSGEEGEENKDNPPNYPDPSLTIPPLDGGVCPEGFTLVQCAYMGDYYNPYGDITMDNSEFSQLILAIFSDIKHREPVGGYDFANRSVYDTPLWDNYGKYTGNVCFGNDCYKRSEVNYVAQGMWVAASKQTNAEGRLGVTLWKLLSFLGKPLTYFPPVPSDGTLIWFDRGYDTYQVLDTSYPYSSP